MRKIPTLFVRDFSNDRCVIDRVTEGCEWVIEGEGIVTRKWDGTCVLWDGTEWLARRQIKPGKPEPAGFVLQEFDEETGKRVGWEPAAQSPWVKLLAEAVTNTFIIDSAAFNLAGPPVGTYELCGPSINGNPEMLAAHKLIKHGEDVLVGLDDRTYSGCIEALGQLEVEGFVFYRRLHDPDSGMVKIKTKDFRELKV